MNYTMMPDKFIAKWQKAELKERSGAQEHFIDLCHMLDEPTPADADSTGEDYCFERGANKDAGGKGWADVWKRGHFAWEYKGKQADLDSAFNQLRQYALALENPPLLIVSDMARFRIRTNWTNSVSETHEFEIGELIDPKVRDKLKWALSDPEQLRPGVTRQMLTEQAAEDFALLAQGLRKRGFEPQNVAHFINRLVFCMFAEDVDLLPNNMFTRMLEQAYEQPEEFKSMSRDLFAVMSTGGRIGFEKVAWFNGGLFDDDLSLPLSKAEIRDVLQVAKLEWGEVDPSILGTLFERGLDPNKRAQLGAHYTDRNKIMAIVEPVIRLPLLTEWKKRKKEIAIGLKRAETSRSPAVQTRQRRHAERLLRGFLERLRKFTVLDPACGSGNFLYLALHTLKDLEHQVQIEAEAMGFPMALPAVDPANVKGIEINSYAAELARVSVWIGHIQWMRDHGFTGTSNPILKPLDTIECRDAILTCEGEEPEWIEADVVIGNPPFLGGKRLRRALGDEYVEALQRLYGSRIHGEADLVCHWFDKARRLVADGKLARVGLVATNSISGGRNRSILEQIAKRGIIFDAWADEPWIVDGAAVRVSLVCFAPKDAGLPVNLNGQRTQRINTDLTSGNLDLAQVSHLARNANLSFMGDTKNGSFDIPGDLARAWLRLPTNPNGRPNSDVLKPWANGMDLTRRSAGKWIIDFGPSMNEADAAFYEMPFFHVEKYVKPARQKNRARKVREFWWRHEAPRPTMWRALNGLSRYIATPLVAKHRTFVWLDSRICPSNTVIVIARDDDTTFGILHSRFHELWSLRQGTRLGQGNDPRYTPTTTFATYPFPEGLTPDIPAADYAEDLRAVAIAEAARWLVELRAHWLNPPDWVEWVDEPVSDYPKRPIARDEVAAKKLRTRTLTNLYNARPQWLVNAHASLDAAVADAYGWPADISDDEVLGELLARNLAYRER